MDRTPDSHATFSESLSNGKFKMEQRDAFQDKQDEERDHESSCGITIKVSLFCIKLA